MANNKYFKDLGYRVTSPYGIRTINGLKEFHTGVDLVTTPKGDIEAFVDGVVVYSGEGKPGTGYGNFGIVAAIKDKKGAVHLYAHLSKVVVKKGEAVKKGQVIGNQGNTGRSFGEHLHYEVRPQERWINDPEERTTNPENYLLTFK